METLICETCGNTWERPRKGGPKPKTCSPECFKKRRATLDAEHYRQNREQVIRRVSEYASKNEEKVKAYQAKYYETRKEEIKANASLYRLRNLDKINLYQREYYRKNRESIIKSVTDYAKANPEKSRRWAAMRSARVRGAVEREAIDKHILADRYGMTCHICGGSIPDSVDRFHPLYFTMDHVLPLAAGGTHTYENVKPAHASCNKQKSDKVSGWEDIEPIIPGEFKE